jgi:hypothetical protein
MRKTMLTIALAVGVVVATASAALAHECINVSRNAQGTAGAAGSNGWFTLTLDMLYAEVVADPGEGFPPADTSAVPAMVAEAESLGVPSELAILAHATAAGGRGVDGTWITSDGHGIDHFVDLYFPQLVQAYCDNASGDPTGTICDVG